LKADAYTPAPGRPLLNIPCGFAEFARQTFVAFGAVVAFVR